MKLLSRFFYRAGVAVGLFNLDAELVFAAGGGQTDKVKALLAAGADGHFHDDLAIAWASASGHKETVEFLDEWMMGPGRRPAPR